MINFLKKYSLVLVISITAGLLIGFKTFYISNNNQPPGTVKSSTTPTSTPTPTSIPKQNFIPTIPPSPTISEENIKKLLEEFGIDPENPEESIEKILIELNIDPENPEEEDLQKILDFLEKRS